MSSNISRRSFVQSSALLTLGVLSSRSLSFGKNPPKRSFMLGIDTSGDRYAPGQFFNRKAMELLGVDFVVYHYSTPKGTIQEEAAKMEKLGKAFEEANLKVIVNLECGNWNYSIKTPDGHEWVTQPGDLQFFKLPPPVLEKLGQSNAVWGVQYDELEHSQITRNLTITLQKPGVERVTLVETTGMDLKTADQAICEKATELVKECRQHGVKEVYTEHVWPVLFHNFARAGMVPVYKQMKENFSNVWASCAMGACLQYDQELWACLDFWNYNTFPGHSANSLWSNLLFAYWAGVDKAYVESVGKHTYQVVDQDYDNVKLLERGEVFQRFKKEYIKANPRSYTFRDIEPEIAIIRFDDTAWGQGPATACNVKTGDKIITYTWKDWLFGAYDLNTSPESEEWIKAWSTVTHGRVREGSLSWNACNVYQDDPYRCFAPANSAVVFDDQVDAKHLKTLKLAFLCGHFISKKTMEAVAKLVKMQGLVVVTSKRFAPEKYTASYKGGTQAFTDGKGKWIITDNMASHELRTAVTPFIGKEDEITLRFKGGKKVVMKISPDGNELSSVAWINS